MKKGLTELVFVLDMSGSMDHLTSDTIGGFNVGICDYWFSAGQDPRGRYFKYDAHGTNHIFEANVGYDFGPVAFQWYTNFTGNDYKLNGKRAYSSYFEFSAPFKLATCDWTATAGAVPFGAEAVYGTEDFAVTNLSLRATKDINERTSGPQPACPFSLNSEHFSLSV